MTSVLSAANPTLRFVLELCALAALSFWGAQTGGGLPVELTLGVATPLAAAALWWLWVAPRATRRLSDPARFCVELVVWSAAAAAIVATDHPILALTFGVAALVTAALVRVWPEP